MLLNLTRLYVVRTGIPTSEFKVTMPLMKSAGNYATVL